MPGHWHQKGYEIKILCNEGRLLWLTSAKNIGSGTLCQPSMSTALSGLAAARKRLSGSPLGMTKILLHV